METLLLILLGVYATIGMGVFIYVMQTEWIFLLRISSTPAQFFGMAIGFFALFVLGWLPIWAIHKVQEG